MPLAPSSAGASKIHPGLEEGARVTPRVLQDQWDVANEPGLDTNLTRAREREREFTRERVRAERERERELDKQTRERIFSPATASAMQSTRVPSARRLDVEIDTTNQSKNRDDYQTDDVSSPFFLRDPSHEVERYRLQARAIDFRREDAERMCTKVATCALPACLFYYRCFCPLPALFSCTTFLAILGCCCLSHIACMHRTTCPYSVRTKMLAH